MFEILTKEPAYNEYMDYMEIDEVLDCISGRRPVPQQVYLETTLSQQTLMEHHNSNAQSYSCVLNFIRFGSRKEGLVIT